MYTITSDFKLLGCTNSDSVGNVDDRKSTLGYILCVGSKAISQASNKQPIVSLLIEKVEYVVTTRTTRCQAVLMRRLLKDLWQE